MKYSGINITKHVQDLDFENYKMVGKKIQEDLNKWRDIPYSWILRLNMVKMSILSKLIYKFSAIPVKNLSNSFCRH